VFKIPESLLAGKYRFVTLAAQRAEQLQAGALPRVESPSNKVTVVAQQEVADERIQLHEPGRETAEGVAEVEEEE
jgi:DNA-directed RNA polymerase subunit K/omega